jgi:hypothetical protein
MHLQGKELMIISSPYGKTSIFPQMLLKSSPMEAWKNFQQGKLLELVLITRAFSFEESAAALIHENQESSGGG